jgi:glycosyltransferase A (GT-A) superfamily protein (DUF2064 family)
MRFPSARILVFAKAPVPGQCKTRLIPALGAEGAARLAEDLLCGTLERVTQAGLAPVELWCAPQTRHPLFVRLSERLMLRLEVQHGADLGARMQAAAEAALGRAEQVVLIGTDCPALDADYLQQALQALTKQPTPHRPHERTRPTELTGAPELKGPPELKSPHKPARPHGLIRPCEPLRPHELNAQPAQAVLGPAEDGGYVLLGLRREALRALPALFSEMPWGGGQVAAITRQRLRDAGLVWTELISLADIDEPEDLARLGVTLSEWFPPRP